VASSGGEPSQPTHPPDKYSIEEAVAKMIQSMYMAFGFRVPVYPKISGTSTALAVLNNLTRNPYAAGLAIDGEDGAPVRPTPYPWITWGIRSQATSATAT